PAHNFFNAWSWVARAYAPAETERGPPGNVPQAEPGAVFLFTPRCSADCSEYRQAAGVGAQVSAQPVAVSIDHDLVVIIQRSKWTLRTRHHRQWWLIASTSKRTGGGRFSAANPPCSDTNQDQGRNGSDEQGDLT